jgi:hypothetical protein
MPNILALAVTFLQEDFFSFYDMYKNENQRPPGRANFDTRAIILTIF